MRKMKLLYPVTFLLVLACAMLSGCGDDDDDGRDDAPAGAVEMNPITGANAEGNIQIAIGGVTIDSPPVVTFALSDENGQPLDPREVLNDPSSRLRFYIARLDDKGRYLNYIPNDDRNDDLDGLRPSYDSNGDPASIRDRIAQVKPGVYTYTFATDIQDSTKTFQHFTSNSNLGTKRRTTFDPTKTHTVVIQLLRNTVKNGKPFRQTANPYFNFRPDGGEVTQTREIVAISACNQCHGKLAVHGGSRIDIPLCIVCHTVGVSEDGTGGTASIDLKVMVHSIHMGKSLPSKAYFQTAAFRGYSTLTYPVFSADPVAHTVPIDCVKCHRQGTDIGGKSFGRNVERYKVATRDNCITCHNSTSFAGESTLTVAGVPGVPADPHSGGPQGDDSRCANASCHPATGADYSTNSVTGAHAVWEKSPVNPRLVARVLSATNVGPGKYPRVTFQLTDGAGNPAAPDPGTVTPALAGNNVVLLRNNVEIHVAIKPKNIPDFLNEKLVSDDPNNRFPVLTQTNGGGGSTATVSANAAARSGRLVTVDLGRGIFFINFSTAQTIPATFATATPTLTERPNKLPSLTGDFVNGATIAFAMQASRSDVSITHRGVPTVLGVASSNPANATVPPGTRVNPVIAADMKADVYYDLAAGGAVIGTGEQRRRVVEDSDCEACHNVIAGVHASRRPNAESCVLCHNPNRNDENFVFLIHKLHTGEEGAIGRFRRENIAEEIEFPNQRNRCYICHVAQVPEPVISYPAYTTFNDFDEANNRIPSYSAACLACHDTRENRGAARAHALANTVGFSYIAPTPTSEAVWNVATTPPSRANVERCATCHTPEARALAHQLEY